MRTSDYTFYRIDVLKSGLNAFIKRVLVCTYGTLSADVEFCYCSKTKKEASQLKKPSMKLNGWSDKAMLINRAI